MSQLVHLPVPWRSKQRMNEVHYKQLQLLLNTASVCRAAAAAAATPGAATAAAESTCCFQINLRRLQ